MNTKHKWMTVLCAAVLTMTMIPMGAITMANNQTEQKKAVKIVQTAGRDRLGKFAPDFARYNDDILFGEVWSRNDKLSLHDQIGRASCRERV